ncbi:MAG: hypothetical protein E7C03_01400 [Anaerococcus sp.]|nr:hypothetical protein HMPREF3224_01105 [Anaerococcus hydrogenalis]MDU2829119.1 hypothetical protein [Anaerococcus sp.]MDU6064049.1 hypothetical protein [Anaerococcus sp.]
MYGKGGKWTIGLLRTDSAKGGTSTGVIDAMNAVLESFKDVIAIMEENILEVIIQDNYDEIEEINMTIAEKQKERLALVRGKKDYSKCADEMEELRQNKQLLFNKACSD